MTQREKLDFILKQLSIKGFGSLSDIESLFRDNNLNIDDDEADQLGDRLTKLGYIQGFPNSDGYTCRLTSLGMEYVEGDSFSSPGTPIQSLTVNHITGGHQSPIVIGNQNTVSQSFGDIDRHINDIVMAMAACGVNINDINEIKDGLEEIKTALANGGKPKSALKYIWGLTKDVSTVAGLVANLNKVYNILPIDQLVALI